MIDMVKNQLVRLEAKTVLLDPSKCNGTIGWSMLNSVETKT